MKAAKGQMKKDLERIYNLMNANTSEEVTAALKEVGKIDNAEVPKGKALYYVVDGSFVEINKMGWAYIEIPIENILKEIAKAAKTMPAKGSTNTNLLKNIDIPPSGTGGANIPSSTTPGQGWSAPPSP